MGRHKNKCERSFISKLKRDIRLVQRHEAESNKVFKIFKYQFF